MLEILEHLQYTIFDIQRSPFIMLPLGSIRMDCVLSEFVFERDNFTNKYLLEPVLRR